MVAFALDYIVSMDDTDVIHVDLLEYDMIEMAY